MKMGPNQLAFIALLRSTPETRHARPTSFLKSTRGCCVLGVLMETLHKATPDPFNDDAFEFDHQWAAIASPKMVDHLALNSATGSSTDGSPSLVTLNDNHTLAEIADLITEAYFYEAR